MNLKEAVNKPIFHILGDCANELGLRSFVIGGYVRDHLLKRPSKDVDVVVEGRGIDLAKAFGRKISLLL